MAITLSSNAETEEQMLESLKSFGVEFAPKVVEPPAEAAKPAEEAPKPAAEPEKPAETVTASEPVKPTQETPSQEPEAIKPPESTEVPKPVDKNKGGTVERIEKLTRRAAQLEEALEAEKGDKRRMQAQLDEVNSKLTELAPKPEVVLEPARPKRPTRAESDFDEARYEIKMNEYETALDDYHAQRAEAKAGELLAKADATRIAAAQQKEAAANFNAYKKRREEGRLDFEDWDEYLGPYAEPVDVTPAIEGFLYDCEAPAAPMYFLATHPEERERIYALNAIQQLREITRIHDRLQREKEAKTAPAPEKTAASTATTQVVPAAAAPAPAKPATPPLKTPDAPIVPLGGQGSTSTVQSLEKAAESGPKSYLDARRREIAQKNASRV